MEKKKVELIIYKNNKKAKNNLRVDVDIPHQKLLEKLKNFTKKTFTIEIESKDQKNQIVNLTSTNLKQFMHSYKGEKINIKTTYNDNDSILDQSISNQQSQLEQFQEQSVLNEKSFSINKKEKIYVEQKVQLKMQSQKQKLSIESNLQNNKMEMIQNERERDQNTRSIVQYFQNKSLQRIYGKQQMNNGKKRCSQCKRHIVEVYFICLVCPRQIILCSQCQSNRMHSFRGHAFAKIKRWTQQIKSRPSIQTSLYQQISSQINKKIQQIIIKKVLQKQKKVFLNNIE